MSPVRRHRTSGKAIPDEDLAVLEPQYREVRKLLADHRLSGSLDELAAAITLKVVAMTWAQVTEAAPELAGQS